MIRIVLFLLISVLAGKAHTLPSPSKEEKAIVKKEAQFILRQEMLSSLLEELDKNPHNTLESDRIAIAKGFSDSASYYKIKDSFLSHQLLKFSYKNYISNITDDIEPLRTPLFINPKNGTSVALLNVLAVYEGQEFIKLEIKNLSPSQQAGHQQLHKVMKEIKKVSAYSRQNKIKAFSSHIDFNEKNPLIFESTIHVYIKKDLRHAYTAQVLSLITEKLIPLNNNFFRIRTDKHKKAPFNNRAVSCMKLL